MKSSEELEKQAKALEAEKLEQEGLAILKQAIVAYQQKNMDLTKELLLKAMKPPYEVKKATIMYCLLYVKDELNLRINEALPLIPAQTSVIDKIIAFAKNAKIDDKPTIQYNITPALEEEVRRGICNGLASMYLLCSFISDMQQEKEATDEEDDDLHWFCKNIILLHFQHEKLSVEQKKQLGRFIGLLIHQQYNKRLEPDAMNETDNTKFDFSINLITAEFTGQHQLNFDEQSQIIISNKQSMKQLLALAQRDLGQPLYLQIAIYKKHHPSGHMVTLHRDKDNNFHFYDPNGKVKLVKLADEKDAEKFYISLVNMYAENDEQALKKCGLIIHSAHPGPKTAKDFKI